LINALAINFAQELKNNCVCLGKVDRQGVKAMGLDAFTTPNEGSQAGRTHAHQLRRAQLDRTRRRM